MAYDLHDLELIGFTVKTLLKVEIEHQPGEHGRLEIEADLGEEERDYSVQEAWDGQRILLRGACGEKKEPIFYGIITELNGKSVGNSYYIRIIAHTYSYLMDVKKRFRSFQDVSITMETLLSQIAGEYGGVCQILFSDRALGEIAVQYNETDWEFMKRMLSAWNIPLAASEVREGICLYAGVAEIPVKMEIKSVEGAEKLLDEKAYWTEKGMGAGDDEFIQYKLRLNSPAALYSQVAFRDRTWIVSRLLYESIGGRLYPVVTLRKKSGIREKSIFPIELVGSAIEGEILQVKGEKARIHLTIDEGNTGKDCYWFPFSTPSASSDGSGWYYMPEKGDKVRVYFPSKHTKEVIAISAVSDYQAPVVTNMGKKENLQPEVRSFPAPSDDGGGVGNGESYSRVVGSEASVAVAAVGVTSGGEKNGLDKKSGDDGKDKMGNPTTKYLSTPDGHALKLMKKGIEIVSNNGTVKIEVLKSGKISLYAKKKIIINTSKEVVFRSGQLIKVCSEESMCMSSQQGGTMELNEKEFLIFKGTEICMN